MKSSANRSAGPADDDEVDHAPPVHRVVSAANAAPPKTNAAPSIFAAGQAAKPQRSPRRPPDPLKLQIKVGVPIPPKRMAERGQSTYQMIWDRMPVGAMVELTASQANGFASWAKKAGKRDQLVRRALDNGNAGCWRVAPGAAT